MDNNFKTLMYEDVDGGRMLSIRKNRTEVTYYKNLTNATRMRFERLFILSNDSGKWINISKYFASMGVHSPERTK